jgi:hypothetical protein
MTSVQSVQAEASCESLDAMARRHAAGLALIQALWL